MTKMQKAAVIGHPIGHTMSPFIQRRLFELSGIPMEYQVMDVPDLEAALPELRRLDCFNITIPHKSSIIPYLDGIDDRARLCGSVNTVKAEEGRLYGFTTDGPGAEASLGIHSLGLQGELLLLGNGGAAKAIAFQAAEHSDFHITLVHRSGSCEKAMELAGKLAEYARSRGDKNFLVTVESYEELEQDTKRYDLLINTTSVGMYPHTGISPVSEKSIGRCAAVFDAVFNPAETELMRLAKKQDIRAVGGMGMLVCQAAYSHKIWYGSEFKESDLRALILNAQKEMERIFGGDGI